MFSRLNRKIDIPQLKFFRLDEIYLGGLLDGKMCRKPMFKMNDTNLKKTCSVLLSLTISGLDNFNLCFEGSSKSISDWKTTKNLYYVFISTIKIKEEHCDILSKYRNYRIIIIVYRIIINKVCACIGDKKDLDQLRNAFIWENISPHD